MIAPPVRSTSAPPAFPPRLRAYVTDFIRRARRRTAARAAGQGTAAFLAFGLACCAADRWLQLPPYARLALLLVGLCALAAIVARPLYSLLRRRSDWLEAAEALERHDARFSQRLLTVTARLSGPPEHRGSDDLLFHLLTDVERDAAARSAPRPVPPRAILLPWLITAVLVATCAWLGRSEMLGLPRLALRFGAPLADVEPVTTTRLAVLPGNATLPQARPLRIEVTATRLPADEPVWLTWQEERASPVRRAMSREGPGRFSLTLPSVGRDLHYHVSAGDARSRDYSVRVLRPPAVAGFEVRYVYPAYADRSPVTVTNTDGQVEAPAGTEVTLTVTATEPLQSALLRLPNDKVLMGRSPADPDNVRRASFKLERGGPYELDLISTREVAGSGPPAAALRIVSDRKPIARLVNAGQALRLNPREILTLAYQALDDFGIDSLVVKVQSGVEAKEYSVRVDADPRRAEGTYSLDLAPLKLAFGDVLSVSLVARDRAGQEEASEPLQVLVAPRSVDIETHQRITELETAAQLVGLVTEELDATVKSAAEARSLREKNPDASAAAAARGNRFLTTSVETAVLARQSLLRAIIRTRSPELATALATLVDSVQLFVGDAEQVFQSNALAGDGNAAGEKLTLLAERGAKVRDQLRAVAQGERAAAILLDRENLAASERRAAADPQAAQRVRQTLQRAAEDVAAGVAGLGLDPAAANVDELLRGKVGAEQDALKAQRPVDFAAAAREWTQAVRRDPLRRLPLDERFALAAQAEAVGPAADLARAHDLHLCSRAANRVATDAAMEKYAGRPPPADALDKFAGAVAALEREHEIGRRPADVRPPAELQAVRDSATAARRLLSEWAGAEPPPSVAEVQPANRRAEDLALRGSARLAARDYAAARAADRELLRQLVRPGQEVGAAAPDTQAAPSTEPLSAGPPVPSYLRRELDRVDHLTDKAEVIDRVQGDQDKLARETRTLGASTTAPASPDLAGRQADVAQRIAEVTARDEPATLPFASRADASPAPAQDPNWRGRATAAVIAAQEQLAALPQTMTRAQEEAATLGRAAERVEMARREVAAATQDRRRTVEQAARQAEQELEDAQRHFRTTVLPSLAGAAASLASGLAQFEPETAAPRGVVDGRLVPALKEFEQACLKGDTAAAERLAAAARDAVDGAHRELARVQEDITARDPLVAARWFARAAADSLSRSPPDVRGAYRRQMDASEALGRAWDRTVHEAAAQRLSVLPSMQGLFRASLPPPLASRPKAPGEQPGGGVSDIASVREWGRLRTREVEDLNTSLRESEAPGYERALQLYFESLNRPPAPPPK